MPENKTTVAKLFAEENAFAVPAYQRAYSWETTGRDANVGQIEQFITDLREQPSDKRYFMGHFLFETNPTDENAWWIIDGQQHLTTIVIFFRMLYGELKSRQASGEVIVDGDGVLLDVERVFQKYVKDRARIKFTTVHYDNAFFEHLLVAREGSATPTTDTRSKGLILAARNYFAALMKEESTTELMRWSRTLANALVTTLEIEDKAESIQIFAFQNDRGKGLTNLEKLKAHLMHQVFLSSEEEDSNTSVKFVEGEFANIYKQIERIDKLEIGKLTEDQILSYYATAFIVGSGSALGLITKAAKDAAGNRVQWIKDFCINLGSAFVHVEQALAFARTGSALGDVLILEPANSWPLILKLFHYHASNIGGCEELFRLMEMTWFKFRFTVGGYRTRGGMDELAKKYVGDRGALNQSLEHFSQHGFQPYWSFNAHFRQSLQGNAWSTDGRYILWKYENELRKKDKADPYPIEQYLNVFGRKNLDSTIDHISPQTPKGEPHSEEFCKLHLHSLGNLVLMKWGKNSQLSNHAPTEKACEYAKFPLISTQDVARTIAKEKQWSETQIDHRKQRIVEFALAYWKAYPSTA